MNTKFKPLSEATMTVKTRVRAGLKRGNIKA
jgi:hypothetical protein